MNDMFLFLKRWGLVLSMITGASAYILFANADAPVEIRTMANKFVQLAQPTLLFLMLLLTFLKVKPSDLHLRRWQLGGLVLQGSFWILGALALSFIPMSYTWRLGMDGFLLFMICPTATAAAVITGKLGGNQGSLTIYIILATLMASLLIPAMIPLIYQNSDITFWTTFAKIVLKIFPLLFLPFVCAIIMRRFIPRLARVLTGIPNAAFYLWMIALSMAIAVSVKNMHHSLNAGHGLLPQVAIAGTSLLACLIQFASGRWLGKHFGGKTEDEIISATQGLGQKNTIFSIWCGYSFMDPLSSIAGGFYSIWHNVYNSYQLAKRVGK